MSEKVGMFPSGIRRGDASTNVQSHAPLVARIRPIGEQDSKRLPSVRRIEVTATDDDAVCADLIHQNPIDSNIVAAPPEFLAFGVTTDQLRRRRDQQSIIQWVEVTEISFAGDVAHCPRRKIDERDPYDR